MLFPCDPPTQLRAFARPFFIATSLCPFARRSCDTPHTLQPTCTCFVAHEYSLDVEGKFIYRSKCCGAKLNINQTSLRRLIGIPRTTRGLLFLRKHSPLHGQGVRFLMNMALAPNKAHQAIFHSCRSATIGSSCAARRAGM